MRHNTVIGVHHKRKTRLAYFDTGNRVRNLVQFSRKHRHTNNGAVLLNRRRHYQGWRSACPTDQNLVGKFIIVDGAFEPRPVKVIDQLIIVAAGNIHPNFVGRAHQIHIWIGRGHGFQNRLLLRRIHADNSRLQRQIL